MTSSHASSPPPTHRHDMLAGLQREWVLLRHRPSALSRARSWHIDAEFRSLDDLVGASGLFASSADRKAASGRNREHDIVLAQLVRAARHDELAARVVLQRLLPGLVACARRWASRTGGQREAIDEVVSAAWNVIRTFSLARLDQQVAARLLRDSEHQAFVKATRRCAVHVPTEPGLLDRPAPYATDPEPIAELAELVAQARNSALSDADLRLLRLLVSGRSMTDVATELDVSVRTVANHRNAMVERLRQVALAA